MIPDVLKTVEPVRLRLSVSVQQGCQDLHVKQARVLSNLNNRNAKYKHMSVDLIYFSSVCPFVSCSLPNLSVFGILVFLPLRITPVFFIIIFSYLFYTLCYLACSGDRFGQNCAKRCLCQNGALCARDTGACTCAAGWKGMYCDQACPTGTFGLKCSSCLCQNGASCDRVTGACTCSPGYYGKS